MAYLLTSQLWSAASQVGNSRPERCPAILYHCKCLHLSGACSALLWHWLSGAMHEEHLGAVASWKQDLRNHWLQRGLLVVAATGVASYGLLKVCMLFTPGWCGLPSTRRTWLSSMLTGCS